jgi:TIGR00159 family protein
MGNPIQDWLAIIWSSVKGVLGTVGIADVLDVLVIALIIYYGIQLIKETRAKQLLRSVAVIILLYAASGLLKMSTLNFLLYNVINYGLIVLIVLFQPELRRALEHIGRSNFSGWGKSLLGTAAAEEESIIDILVESARQLSAKKIGALIVVERETRLGDITTTGTIVDSEPSAELICNIFFPNAPLHDGALILREGRLYAAACYLPLSANDEISRELGTRHRAALGVSEVSDAVVIVVSEETGAISVAMDSRLQRGLSVKNLHKLLQAKLSGPEEKKPARWKVLLGGKNHE